MGIHFYKYEAAGNDFILIEDFSERVQLTVDVIKKWCQSHYGIGADGLILLRPSEVADCRMLFFNSDGSQAEMCGNGLRSVIHFLASIDHKKQVYQVEVNQKIYKGFENEEGVWIHLPSVTCLNGSLPFKLHDKDCYHYNTGVPHLVIPLKRIENLNLNKLAPKWRWDPLFKGEGTNVNFLSVSSHNECSIRTFERGVEGETLACGTGAAAASLFMYQTYGVKDVSIKVRSGVYLKCQIFDVQDGKGSLNMMGPVRFVFEGKIKP
ncbi:MAG: diaminopimelate epimerase [Rhabdochlamydiaceae bacterium]